LAFSGGVRRRTGAGKREGGKRKGKEKEGNRGRSEGGSQREVRAYIRGSGLSRDSMILPKKAGIAKVEAEPTSKPKRASSNKGISGAANFSSREKEAWPSFFATAC
jgi:hypothetical protein